MSPRLLRPLLLGLGLLAAPATAADPPTPHRITQVSVIDALMVGRYDGILPMPDLLRLGDLGVGTLDHLDGELVILDGKPYQIRADGRVLEVGPERSTPFAVVAPFRPAGDAACPPVASLVELEKHLDAAVPQKNHFAAIRIDGDFASLTMRSVARQEPPYQPLDVVAKTQSVWTKQDQTGTLVGVRSPKWAGGLNVPGYHWHFLAADRQAGGHVLDLRVRAARVRHDVYPEWTVKFEDAPGFDAADLVRDRSRELHRVESSRGTKPD